MELNTLLCLPSSNGLAKRAVQTIKSDISKMEGTSRTKFHVFFLPTVSLHIPVATGLSPAERLMGQKIRTLLDLCHPDTAQNVQCKQEKCLIPIAHIRLLNADKLFARNFHGSQKWIPVQVTTILGPLSYQSSNQ